MMKRRISTQHAPAAIGPYSQAVAYGDLVFTSGQLGMIPATGELLEGVEAQTRQAMENLDAVLKAAGSDWTRVIKATIFLADMADFATVNSIYGERFDGDPPARSTVAVRELPRSARVEIDLIAHR